MSNGSAATIFKPLPDDFVGAHATPFTDTRRALRFVPLRSKTSMTLIGGKKMDARIINVSATGIAVEADFSAFGPEAIEAIGLRKVMPGRKIRRGAVFLFVKPIDAKLCKPDIVI